MFFFLMIRRPPRSTLFPYTTLFRSRIAPTFGGIHLEDISAPECFEIEARLIEALDKPVMHDDVHGTAVVTLAAVLDRKSTRLNSSHANISYAVFCLKQKKIPRNGSH